MPKSFAIFACFLASACNDPYGYSRYNDDMDIYIDADYITAHQVCLAAVEIDLGKTVKRKKDYATASHPNDKTIGVFFHKVNKVGDQYFCEVDDKTYKIVALRKNGNSIIFE